MFSNKESSVSSQIGLFEIICQDIDICTRVLIVLVLLVSLNYSQAFCPAGWHVYLALVELTTLGICPNKNIYGRVFFPQPGLIEEVLCGCRPFHLLFENIKRRMANNWQTRLSTKFVEYHIYRIYTEHQQERFIYLYRCDLIAPHMTDSWEFTIGSSRTSVVQPTRDGLCLQHRHRPCGEAKDYVYYMYKTRSLGAPPGPDF